MKKFPGRAMLVALPLCLARAESGSDPLSLDTDLDWYGLDGTWSAVNIYVGSELATASLFPSTVDRRTWLIGGKAYENSSLSDYSTKRGGLFHPDRSSTWRSQEKHPSLSNSSNHANYGSDTILVGFTAVEEYQLAIINEMETWIGLLGLAAGLGDPDDLSTLSLMEQVYIDDGIAPSGSYGYTAGAYYRLKGVPASLTIGGVDQARYSTNNAVFHLNRRLAPVISLNTISISSGTEVKKDTFTHHQIITATPGTNSLYTLDSSTSYIWLPENAFDAFGQAFNLTYDDNLGFYTYGNDTSLRQRLLDMNLSITFFISDVPNGAQSVNITLPFQAFDHSLSYPFPNLPSEYASTSLPYIPVKKASTNREQRIGRVFFQEAYIAVNYENEQFSVYQAKFDEDFLANDRKDIVPIESYIDKSLGLYGKQGLSAGAKAGIGVGTAVGSLLAITAGVGTFIYLRKRRSAREEKGGKLEDDTISSDSASHGPGGLDGDHENRVEMAADNSRPVFELPDSGLAELDAGPSSRRNSAHAVTKPEKRHISRHSETQSSITPSLASRITESSDEEDPMPSKGQSTSPPSYAPQIGR